MDRMELFTITVIWRDSPSAAILRRNGRVQNSLLDYANSKNASGGMVADRWPAGIAAQVDIEARDG
jgi:hypothetical protein